MRKLKPPPPHANGGFDVKPSHLFYVSYSLRNSQIDFSEQANSVLEQLEGYEHAGGCGSGPEAFAAAYAKAAKRFFEVWDKAVAGVGGASVGLTATADLYAGAEYRAHPTPGPPNTKPLPDVLKGKGYRPVPELGWGNPPDELGWGHDFLNNMVGALGSVGEAILRPVFKYALRHGKVADITPGGNDIELPKIAAAWRQAKGSAKKAADDFDDAVSYITNPASGHSEWQDAMKQFCSSIWGTTAWGQDRVGRKWNHKDGQKPALDVLMDTAGELASACDGFGREVKKVRSVIEDVYIAAGKKTFEVKGLRDLIELAGGPYEYAVEFIANLDTGRLDAGVDEYNRAVQALADDLNRLMPALDEAHRSVPTYAAEEARAEAFGARSLNEFKQVHKYTTDPDENNHFYPIDLANQEGIHGSHVIDKHVGQSDEQLLNRLRDQPTITAASTFPDLTIAQKSTQDAMDEIGPDSREPANAGKPNTGVNNPEKIENWLARPRRDNSMLTLDPVEFDYATGRTVPAGSSSASDTHSVKVVLKYKNGIDPPYVVFTSMPAHP
ncbi:RNase A-like domain-containing protein [Streptomyces lunaelactis]|uniref:RNase A-like domain-containing protein n=1 Tax=Streptomyces lunaelactis TaxID=1535768 RepID=UPI002814E63F|nr:RNase A-like domain-containing protein [Streptomyces lunaelactis]